MTIEHLAQLVQHDGPAAALSAVPATADAAAYQALLAYSQQQPERAAAAMREAVRLAPADALFAAAATYLERLLRDGAQQVYASGAGFAAFVRGGGNVPLYEAVSQALAAVYRETGPLRLLDVGAGDGLALLPALTDDVTEVTLVEPSAAMLGRTEAALRARQLHFTAFAESLQAFAARPAGTWDVIQATWSLQSIPPVERGALLGWLRAHGSRLLIAEFDVPAMGSPDDPRHVLSVLERYRQGLAEYGAERELVAQEFLMPVLFGYFDPTAARVNYEQPIADWVAQLDAAGWRTVTTRPLYGYWWAPAYLIDARA
jgi:hypothetical protein